MICFCFNQVFRSILCVLKKRNRPVTTTDTTSALPEGEEDHIQTQDTGVRGKRKRRVNSRVRGPEWV
jgi:hypothetical protein